MLLDAELLGHTDPGDAALLGVHELRRLPLARQRELVEDGREARR